MTETHDLSLIALDGIPLVEPGDDVAELVLAALAASGIELVAGDILVIAQKIVSKAEGRAVALAEVAPSPEACEWAAKVGKDPRLVELILRESDEVLRWRPGLMIVAHRRGWVLANAGIDRSNVGPDGTVLLLPEDPDASALALRRRIRAATGVDVGVVINDSLGRAWRDGTVGTALGASGVPTLVDLRGRADLFDRPLEITEIGVADEIAAAASLVMGAANEGRPVVLVRGLALTGEPGSGRDLIRDKALDLFR